MSSSASDRRILEAQGPQPFTGSGSANPSLFTRAMTWFEKYLLVLVIGGLLAGVGVASISQPVIDQVDSTINAFMGVYDFVAPVAIFLILTPALARLFATRSLCKFGVLVMGWLRGTQDTGLYCPGHSPNLPSPHAKRQTPFLSETLASSHRLRANPLAPAPKPPGRFCPASEYHLLVCPRHRPRYRPTFSP